MYSQIRLNASWVIAAISLISTAVLAQESQLKFIAHRHGNDEGQPVELAEPRGNRRMARAEMVGLNVYNDENENIGSIAELIKDEKRENRSRRGRGRRLYSEWASATWRCPMARSIGCLRRSVAAGRAPE